MRKVVSIFFLLSSLLVALLMLGGILVTTGGDDTTGNVAMTVFLAVLSFGLAVIGIHFWRPLKVEAEPIEKGVEASCPALAKSKTLKNILVALIILGFLVGKWSYELAEYDTESYRVSLSEINEIYSNRPLSEIRPEGFDYSLIQYSARFKLVNNDETLREGKEETGSSEDFLDYETEGPLTVLTFKSNDEESGELLYTTSWVFHADQAKWQKMLRGEIPLQPTRSSYENSLLEVFDSDNFEFLGSNVQIEIAYNQPLPIVVGTTNDPASAEENLITIYTESLEMIVNTSE